MNVNKKVLLCLWITLLISATIGGLQQEEAMRPRQWHTITVEDYFYRSLSDYLVAELDKPLTPSFRECLDRSLPTLVYTFGYRGRSAGPATTALLTAYINKRKKNVLLLDWEEEAKSGVLGIPLGYAFHAVPNAKKVGMQLGDMLVRLAQSGVNMTELHLMGHSLGAHIMGFAGRRAREQGYTVARITGLDPARALFEGSWGAVPGVDRTCGRFVDIVHSAPGGYGTTRSTGTVDLWPNYQRDAPQPGCPQGDFDMFTPQDLCSHDRSWRYLVESVSRPTALVGVWAADHDAWARGEVDYNRTIYLGDLTNTKAQGNYFFTTNPAPPFGRGFEGLKAEQQPSQRRNTTLTRILALFR